MKHTFAIAALAALALPAIHAGSPPAQTVAGISVDKVVELELLTQTELADKIKNGWTSVFIVAGGTEIRGPHAIIGVHNVLATHRAVEAAKRLGKVIVAPTIPYAVAATGGFSAGAWTAFADNSGPTAPNPGAIQVDSATFKGIVQGAVQSVMYIGFKDVFLMGDHGGGQQEMKQVATEMTEKFAAKGIRVHYVGDFYQKTHDDIDMYMYEHKLPIAGHGGMMETAEMMYWEPISTPTSVRSTRPFRSTALDLKARRSKRISKPGRMPRTDAALARAVAEGGAPIQTAVRAPTTGSAGILTRPRKRLART
jgi:creatinine amidohydrolase